MLYINLINAPDGGGYQNSISFIGVLVDIDFDFDNVCVIAFKDTEIERICVDNNINIILVRKSLLRKVIFELFSYKFLKNGDVVFSLFGPPLLFSEKKTLNIGGMAISNVFYKDVDFWGYLGFFKKSFKKIKDRYRVWRYKKLDFWVFETDLLKSRAVNIFGFPEDRAFVVKMAPSLLVSPSKVFDSRFINEVKESAAKHKFAFISSAHPNKRIHLLPSIAKALKDEGLSFSFILTAADNEYLRKIIDNAKEMGVHQYFINVGPVPADHIASLINACDYVCTFSVLESFSNNFVEAWAMKKPLFVTKAEWSISSCEDAAIYLNLTDHKKTVRKILESIEDFELLSEKIDNGLKLLDKHPKSIDKTISYLSIINYAIATGKIDSKLIKNISL